MKNYRSPNTDKTFEKYWNLYIKSVTNRKNFDECHLQQLEILCDLHCEYNKLSLILEMEGYTFTSEGRYGTQCRVHPVANLRAKVLAEIRAYLKMLDLTLNEEIKEEEVEDEWSERP